MRHFVMCIMKFHDSHHVEVLDSSAPKIGLSTVFLLQFMLGQFFVFLAGTVSSSHGHITCFVCISKKRTEDGRSSGHCTTTYVPTLENPYCNQKVLGWDSYLQQHKFGFFPSFPMSALKNSYQQMCICLESWTDK